MQAPKQNSKNIISDIGVFCDLILFFGHRYRTIEVINVKRRITTPLHPKKTERKTKRKQKEQARQRGRITHLQRRRYMKRNTSIRTPHGKTPPPKNLSRDNPKKTWFFPVFLGNPSELQKTLRIIFRRRQKKGRRAKKWAENGEHETRKTQFSLFL